MHLLQSLLCHFLEFTEFIVINRHCISNKSTVSFFQSDPHPHGNTQRHLSSLIRSIKRVSHQNTCTKQHSRNPSVSNLIRGVCRQVAVCRQTRLIQETESTREITTDKVPGADMKQLRSRHISGCTSVSLCWYVSECVCVCELHLSSRTLVHHVLLRLSIVFISAVLIQYSLLQSESQGQPVWPYLT